MQKEYNDKVKENKTLLSKGLISQKAFNEHLAGLSVEAAKSAASIKGIGERVMLLSRTCWIRRYHISHP